jgi:LPS-assembly protein
MKLAVSRGPGRLAAAACLVLTCAAGAGPVGGQEAGAKLPDSSASLASEFRIVARNKDLKGDRIYASGAVEIHYRQVMLFAESVEIDLRSKDVVAEGNVVIQARDEITRGERVFFNLDTGRARIDNASGMIQPSIIFKADSVEKESAVRYSLRKARVTSCAQPVPRWEFSFSRANLLAGDYVEMWNAVLRIKNVPVMYLPYLRYPLERQRATGLLMPKIGLSGPKGMMYAQSFYWAMARNMDATAGFDYYLSRGLGLGLEYRYLFAKGTSGELNLYTFLFKRNAEGFRPDPAFSLKLSHNQALPGGFVLAANVDYQSSFDFLREFDNSFRQASVSNRSSQVFLSRSWGRFNLSARASLFETYFSEMNDAVRNLSLPLVNFNMFKMKLAGPLFFSMNASFNHWQYGWRSEYEAGTERRSTSLSAQPALNLPISSIPWLTLNTTVKGNFVYYGQSYDAEAGQVVDDPLFTRNFGLNIDLTGPVFYRVFYGRNGQPRLKNIVEPYVNYTYESPVGGSDRIVTSYGFYRFHQLSYGLTSRFLFKQGDRPVEVLSLGLGQTFYLSPEDGPLSRYPVNGRPPRFSELTGTLRFYPVAKYSLDASVGYNPYYRDFSSLRVTATAGAKADNRFLSLSWFKSSNSWVVGIDPTLAGLYNRDQVNAFAGWRLPGWGLDLQGEVDYNIKDRKVLYTAAQAIYHYQCLDFLLELRMFYFRRPPDTQVRFSVGLGNIGRTTDFLGGIGF